MLVNHGYSKNIILHLNSSLENVNRYERKRCNILLPTVKECDKFQKWIKYYIKPTCSSVTRPLHMSGCVRDTDPANGSRSLRYNWPWNRDRRKINLLDSWQNCYSVKGRLIEQNTRFNYNTYVEIYSGGLLKEVRSFVFG